MVGVSGFGVELGVEAGVTGVGMDVVRTVGVVGAEGDAEAGL